MKVNGETDARTRQMQQDAHPRIEGGLKPALRG